MTVDEFVEKKVQPEYRDIVEAIRRLMRSAAPKADEVISYGVPMYRQRKYVAWITPSKTGISFGFNHGRFFEDRYGLLRGAGKHAMNVRMRNLGEVNKTALRYYIKQALAFDRL